MQLTSRNDSNGPGPCAFVVLLAVFGLRRARRFRGRFLAVVMVAGVLASCGDDETRPETFSSYPFDEGCAGDLQVEFSAELPVDQNHGLVCVANEETGRFIPRLPTAAEAAARQNGFDDPCPPIAQYCHTDQLHDAGSLDDAVTDVGSPDAGDAGFDARCDELIADYKAQLELFRDCAEASDCTVIEGTGSCNSTFAFGRGSGDPVNVDFEYPENWDARVEACADWIAEQPGQADAAPADDIRCEAGRCEANAPSCLTE